MSPVITQERARWFNLTGLSDKQKHDNLDETADQSGLFGTFVATMQKWCEEKENRALPCHAKPSTQLRHSKLAAAFTCTFKIPKHPSSSTPDPRSALATKQGPLKIRPSN